VDQGGTGPALVGEPLLDPGEPGDVEEPLEQHPAVLSRRAQERGEVTLGEEYHPAELLEAHAEDVGEHQRDLVMA